jgi:L-2,4-diaminobutyrate decarboxylase
MKGKEKELIVIVSEQAHFCVERACVTMGFNSNQIKKIPVNSQFQMNLSLLSQVLTDVDNEKQQVMAIVVSCCSTATGSYDDLSSVLEISANQNLWIHVDGAHGGSAILSEKYKYLLAGVERAHSIIIDAHKMMLTSSLATFVLFKNEAESYNIFNQDASYLFSQANQEWFNLAKRTYETTKYMMSIKTFVALRYHGKPTLAEFIDRQYDLAREFANHLISQEDFEVAHTPMSNILCFRYHAKSMTFDQVNEQNKSIRAKLLNEGKWYIVQAQLHSETYLRVSIMNALTTMKDLTSLIEDIRAHANSK